ncbi:aminoglycoside adenylyltransferase domain-containing protein [Nesterenkonia populi]|uniref:aminoglycoside adenylyltransferase domain-containing protein n=1 Tax=Nesterenkonia populi TaxID=1591087 RepID=UPI0011BF684F|nr:aminoglycoside adenylyltransferase domain-containing protein [Nesterenkonia populi]
MVSAESEAQWIVDKLEPVLSEGLLGLYICGSAVRGEQGPHSDLDLIALTHETLTINERQQLTRTLLQVSGWAGHEQTFPEAAHRRPVEFTTFVLKDIERWQYPPTVDYRYGEWLRAELVAGGVPRPHEDPDATLFLEDARQNNQTISGPELQNFLSPPPSGSLARACQDTAPLLMEELGEDTRNVLMTLARMAVTVSTETIVSKDHAARVTASRLLPADADLLLRAVAEYRGITSVDWRKEASAARGLAGRLLSLVTSTG